ncbi:MAG: tetratricopeptide repeat protein [Candidatus Omnitrophica bacterium]|nr:tetratricopeptide repeat protein [Candidatus Omnitrophota bacterium]
MLKKLFIFVLMPMSVCAATLDDAATDYIYGDYQEAISKAYKHRGRADGLYFLGLNYIKIGDYAAARKYFKKILRQFPGSKFTEQARIKMADIYFLEKNFTQAKIMYNEIKRKYKISNFLPLVYLRLAQISAKEGLWRDKNKYLNVIENKYPQSSEMRYVKVLRSHGNYFTVQVGAFSSQENANTIKKELQNRYSVYIVSDIKDNLTIYKVRVGKFQRRKSAQTAYAKLLNEGYPAIIYP